MARTVNRKYEHAENRLIQVKAQRKGDVYIITQEDGYKFELNTDTFRKRFKPVRKRT
jgi:hypothetical protein